MNRPSALLAFALFLAAGASAWAAEPPKPSTPGAPALQAWRWSERPPRPDETATLKMPEALKDTIAKAVLAPHGRLAATISFGGRAVAWNLEAGEANLLPDEGKLEGGRYDCHLAFSADGKTLLASSGPRVVAWSMEGRQPVATLEEKTPFAWTGLCSADARLIVAEEQPDKDGPSQWTVREVIGGKRLLAVARPSSGLFMPLLSGDGRTFAVATAEGMRFFDVAGGKERPDLRGVTLDYRQPPHLSFDGATVTIPDLSTNQLTVWDTHDPATKPRLARRLFPTSASSPNLLSPDGKTVIVSVSNSSIGLGIAFVDVATGAVRNMPRFGAELLPSADGRILIAGRAVLDVAAGQPLTVLEKLGRAPSLGADGRKLLWLNSEGGTATVLPLLPDNAAGAAPVLAERAVVPLPGLSHLEGDFAWSPDSRYVTLACGGADNLKVSLLDAEKGKELGRFPGPGGGGFLGARLYKPGGNHAGTVSLPDAKFSGQAKYSRIHVDRTAVAPDGKTVAVFFVGGPKPLVVLTAPDLKKQTPLLDRHVARLAFSPDGKRLALAETTGAVHLFNLDERKEEPTTAAGAEAGLQFIDGGAGLACLDRKGKLRLHDVASGQLRDEPALGRGHVGEGLAIALHPHKPWLVTGGRLGDVLLKDLATGAILQRLDLGAHEVRALSFSPDGKLLVVGVQEAKNKGLFALRILTVKQ